MSWRRLARWSGGATPLAAALLLASCGGGGTVPPAKLALAVSFLPAGTSASYTFEFADWTAIERSLGLPPGGLTTTQTGVLLTRLERLGAPPAGPSDFDLNTAKGAIWSAPDVAWDASEAPFSAGPVSMTGFIPQFPLSSVEHRLAGCRFTARSQNGVPVYTAPVSVVLNCAGPLGTNLPTSATAYAVEAQNHMVLTGSPSAVSTALGNQASGSPRPVLRSLLQALLPASAVGVGVGPKLCSELSQPSVLAGRSATAQAVARASRMYLPAAAYQGFGFGYTYSSAQVSGRLAFTYADAQTANSDLHNRQHTLRTGVSLITGRGYAEGVGVRSSRAAGDTAILDVGPGTSGRLELALLLTEFDLGFARCG